MENRLVFLFHLFLSISLENIRTPLVFWCFQEVRKGASDIERVDAKKLINYSSKKQPFAMFFKIGVLKYFAIFTGKHRCWSLLLVKLHAYNFIKKETPTQVFSYEYCKLFKNSFFYRTPPGVSF